MGPPTRSPKKLVAADPWPGQPNAQLEIKSCDNCFDKHRCGNSVGVVLPKDLLATLRVSNGETIFAVETPNGVELTPYDLDFAAQIDMAEALMREDRDVLKKLAE
ncbi:MAG: hypothetical protein ACK414_01260 [Gemmobacter sp.]